MTGADVGVDTNLAVISLAVAIVGHAITGLFSTPKESVRKLEEWVKDETEKLQTRIGAGEDVHSKLERDFIRVSVRLDTNLKQHTETVRDLISTVKELDRKVARL